MEMIMKNRLLASSIYRNIVTHADVKTCRSGIFCLGKTCCRQFILGKRYQWQPSANHRRVPKRLIAT